MGDQGLDPQAAVAGPFFTRGPELADLRALVAHNHITARHVLEAYLAPSG